jgi:uncharacterized membrane protein YczE
MIDNAGSRLAVGIVLLGIGIALTLEARLGISPFDVLHQGIARQTGLSIGTVVILVGLAILLLWIPLRQRLGVGTVINALTVGALIDLGVWLLPAPDALAVRWLYLTGGIVVTGLGMGLYISAGLGPGPRDGLMTGIAARGHPIWLVRTGLEATALVIGWGLGGDVGIGTVVFAFSIGPIGHYFIELLDIEEPAMDLGPGTAAE